jgi:hypothetical protein
VKVVRVFVRAREVAFALALMVFALGASAGADAQTPGAARGAYRIAGTAVDATSGKPVARAEVSIDLIEGKNSHETYATGADGAFSFEGLAAGRYQLSAKRRGYVSQSYQGHGKLFTAIVIGPGMKTENVRFAMTAGGSIVGHVLDERGDAVRQGRVLLLREVSTGRGKRLTRGSPAETNDLGAYRFDHLEPGAYVVAVIARPWIVDVSEVNWPVGTKGPLQPGDVDTEVAYPVTFYPGALDADAAGRITLNAGESATADVSLSPVPLHSVSVKSYEDDPNKRVRFISAVQYIADGITEPVYPPTITTTEDTIAFAGLPPNRVDIAWAVGAGKDAKEHMTSLNLSGKDMEKSSAPTVIHGVLEGPGVAGMTVKLAFGAGGGGKTYTATVGAKGEFEFREELLSGLYTVEVPALADASLGMRLKGAGFFRDSVEIQPGREIEMKILAGRAGRVRGRVVKSGAAAEGILVALVPEGFEGANNLMRVGQSDSNGAFEMGDVVPGKYVLIAVEGGWGAAWRSAEFLGRFVGGGKKVEVGAGGTTMVEIEARDGNLK